MAFLTKSLPRRTVLKGIGTTLALPFLDAIAHAWSRRNIPELLAQAGLIALISLPFLRVLMTAVLFIKQKDFALAAVAGFVLMVLIISCLLGLEL